MRRAISHQQFLKLFEAKVYASTSLVTRLFLEKRTEMRSEEQQRPKGKGKNMFICRIGEETKERQETTSRIMTHAKKCSPEYVTKTTTKTDI